MTPEEAETIEVANQFERIAIGRPAPVVFSAMALMIGQALAYRSAGADTEAVDHFMAMLRRAVDAEISRANSRRSAATH